jgi:hypothetical protein
MTDSSISKLYWTMRMKDMTSETPRYKNLISRLLEEKAYNTLNEMRLIESSKSDDILDRLQKSVETQNVEATETDLMQALNSVPNKANTQMQNIDLQSKEEVEKASESALKKSVTSVFPKLTNFIMRVWKWSVLHVNTILGLIIVASILLLTIVQSAIKNKQSFTNRHNFQNLAKNIRVALLVTITLGSIYFLVKIFRSYTKIKEENKQRLEQINAEKSGESESDNEYGLYTYL